MERFGISAIQFILQLILARLLDPEHYGILATMMVFTSFANIFIQSGFNTALIQNKDVTDEDYSSVFWLSFSIATILYCVIFITAPLIATFYKVPTLTTPLRVLALMLFPGVLNSIQLAKVSREMDFRKVFSSSIIGVAVSGLASVLLAYVGFGIWALVLQNVLNVATTCAVMFFTVKWRPRLVCNLSRIAVLFRFGWKILVSNLLNILDENIQSVIIGRKYNTNTLGYYSRGGQFPQFIIVAIVDAVQSVMLPAMSAKQENHQELRSLTKSSITVSSYLIFPMMGGLACVSEPLICILLSEKWLPCVPYMQIICAIFAFYTIHTCNLQAINAMGRSDLFLKLEIIKKCYELPMIAGAVLFFDSPMAIALTGIINSWISWFINAFPTKKLIHYSFKEQFIDILPSLLISLVMCACVSLVGYFCRILSFSYFLALVIQVFSGILVYLLLSCAVKPQPYLIMLSWLKGQKSTNISA